MMVAQIKYGVSGTTINEIRLAAEKRLQEFMPDEPVEKWRVVIEIHEHATEGEWMAHVTVRPRRPRSDDDEYDVF